MQVRARAVRPARRVAAAIATAGRARAAGRGAGPSATATVGHIVVIYQENHSFDNLYGRWEGVRGLRDARPRAHPQVNQQGEPFSCLLQVDVNLTSPPLSDRLRGRRRPRRRSPATSRNAPFLIDDFIPPTATTCPAPGSQRAERRARRAAGCPAAARAIWCTATTRSSTSSTTAARTATSPAATRSA